MATDYISRAELYAAFCKASAPAFDNHGKATFIVDYVKVLETIPAADVRPVVRGKWIDEPIKGVRYHCSVCQGRFDYTWHFCPNCGAKMDKDGDGDV